MFEVLKSIFSGRSMKKKHINGRLYIYDFVGNPTYFDPIQMLTDFYFRFQDTKVQRMSYLFQNDPINSLIILPPKWEMPAVTCSLKIKRKILEVNRYIFRLSGSPASHYRFYYDGEEILRFTRIYQMASYHQNLGLKLASVHKDNLDLSRSQWSWENEGGKVLFLENFGYPQLWDISNINHIKNMIN
ncbi:hypothetical protein [Algoriphagus formosus]|uniref:hypothetical protein n=1 Tax=Algoriphagus formosus TaxID=2007308 RepID=UPI003F7243DF